MAGSPGLGPTSSHGSLASFTTEDLSGSADGAHHKQKKLTWYRRFAYQRFVGWRPILNPRSAELFFLAVGVLGIAMGIPILLASLGVKKYSARYDDAGPFRDLNATQAQRRLFEAGDAGVQYSVDIAVQEDMAAPVRALSLRPPCACPERTLWVSAPLCRQLWRLSPPAGCAGMAGLRAGVVLSKLPALRAQP
jgi:hypothetical protein